MFPLQRFRRWFSDIAPPAPDARNGLEDMQEVVRLRLLRLVGIAPSDVRFQDGYSEPNPCAVRLLKTGGGVIIDFDAACLGDNESWRANFAVRMPTLLAIFLDTEAEVREALVNWGDGAEGQDVLCFCTHRPEPITVVDCDFVESNGYDRLRALGHSPPAWSDRSTGFLWRSSTTGRGAITSANMVSGDLSLTQRTQLCLALCDVVDADVKYMHLVQSEQPELDMARLVEAGIWGERMPAETWASRKFAFDVDGNTNTFSNLFTRLLLGCCVLKVRSGRGYHQWYYEDLVPWTHYVPVGPDLADVHTVLEWCRTHDAECEKIAAAGHAFAHARTVESEIAFSVAKVNARLGVGAN